MYYWPLSTTLRPRTKAAPTGGDSFLQARMTRPARTRMQNWESVAMR